MQGSARVAGRSHATRCKPLGFAASLPVDRVSSIIHRLRSQRIFSAAAEAAAPAAGVDNVLRTEAAIHETAPIGAGASDLRNKGTKRSRTLKDGKKSGNARGKDASSQQPGAGYRALIKERSQLLLKGEAVGMSMYTTPADVAAAFRGIRPLTIALKGDNQTLLFFPSTRLVKPEQPPEARADGAGSTREVQPEAQAEGEQQPQSQQEQDKWGAQRTLDLALVAVPYFRKPDPEVTIRVAAKSQPNVVAQMLTRALLRSSTVALHAAGPSAALVALLAAAQARSSIGTRKQLDLAFSLEYLRLSASETDKPATDEEQVAPAAEAPAEAEIANGAAATVVEALAPAATAPAAEAPAKAESSEEGGASSANPASVLQFSFYKRALPTPEVSVSDFARTRAIPALSQLLSSLINERREVDLVLHSRDALFTVQVLTRVVRSGWLKNNASLGVFLTSLVPDAEDDKGEAFTARLQLRRMAGAPNLVPVSGGDGHSLLGPAVGNVKWDSPISPLASAMTRELYSAGIFSVWPQEGVCVARTLRALWQAQQDRAAALLETAEAPTPEAADGGEAAAADAAAASSSSSSQVVEIAIIPEIQNDGRGAVNARGGSAAAGGGGRHTVLHLLEWSALLVRTLRTSEGRVVRVSGGEELSQLVKSVVLRNRMYGNRPGGKTLALRPLLDDSGALAMRHQFIDSAIIASIPQPPAPGGEAPAAAAVAEDDGYATDDEYGLGAEAAVLVPQAAAAAAAAATATSAKAAVPSATGKSPWVMFATSNSSSMRLAMGIVAETCKPYDRRCPVWLKIKVHPDTIATAGLSVAMAQAQVLERANVELLVVPVLERKRDFKTRPYNALTWQLIKYGSGAEAGQAAAAAAASGQPLTGPSPAAIAAAAAAAAKVQARGDALIGGVRKLW